MSGVITIDTGARSAVTAATGRTAGRTESAVQHDTKSPAVAARTKRAFMVGRGATACVREKLCRGSPGHPGVE